MFFPPPNASLPPMAAGVFARLLLGYNAADLMLEGSFLAGLIDGPYAGVTVGALVGIPALLNGEWIALPFAVVPLVWFTASRGRMGGLVAPWTTSALAAMIAMTIIGLNAKLVLDALTG